MKKTDPVGVMAMLLLAAVSGRDAVSVERAASYCVEMNAAGDERTELLAALAESARERSRQGDTGLGPAEWSLLTHLASATPLGAHS